MPDISPTYIKVAENNINILHVKCTRGLYADRLFKMIIRGLNKFYPLEKLQWMKDFLNDNNQQIAAGCLESLCRHGMKLDEVKDIISNRIKDRFFSNKVIEIAEKENNPDILLLFMDEDEVYINRVILALKKTHNESYLTTLMLSDNEALVNAINKLTK